MARTPSRTSSGSRKRPRSRKKSSGGSRPPADALVRRFETFLAERHPFLVSSASAALRRVLDERRGDPGRDGSTLDALRTPLRLALDEALGAAEPGDVETTPATPAGRRWARAKADVMEDADGFVCREAIAASLTAEEKREILQGMILTRATDNRLKALFTGSELRFGQASFQGKGFRSLGQEAIYAAALRLRRGLRWRNADESWNGDVVAPLIRDLGAALAMRPEPDTVRMVLNAQAGKAGPPMEGRDFHIGAWTWGVLPATAPLSISTATVAGLAMAFALEGSDRVAVSFIGEGGTSLGEWHEAINICAVRRLPAVFCVENNQTALSTPTADQSAVRVFADKAVGYGIPGITLDGTDPEAIAAAFAWAAERAREGKGPSLIELVCMRMCGHAHHDDMLYLGKEPAVGWEYPEPSPQGYADARAHAFWAPRDPLARYAERLIGEQVVEPREVEQMKADAERVVEEQARAVIAAPWPDPETVGAGVLAGEPVRRHVEVLQDRVARRQRLDDDRLAVDSGPPFDSGGRTLLEAVMLGVRDALASDPRVFVYGQDVGGKYGNAFLMLRPLLAEFGDRILNAPLSEAGILGVCTGAALAGRRPIGEIQFNDFVATGFNQLVNNAAKARYRWGGSVPMVVRLPWGGLRRAGPYHSQNTEPWFYRTPGLKIVCPSTPHDARALMGSAVADPDPVLFYEHIALYRDPRIKQSLAEQPPRPIPLGCAALRRDGDDLLLVSYGAYVHVALRVADRLAARGTEAAVLDLRSLAPLDRRALLGMARRCGKVLVVHEDSRTGGIGESLAAVIQEEAFEDLDAPVRILGALDTPPPYSPPLEDAFLPSEDRVERAARLLAGY